MHEGNPGGPRHGGSTAEMDPLDDLLWGLAMVKSDLAREVNAGDSRVLVGILDSGIDASHPDLAGQLETSLSRNFVTDIPADRWCVRGSELRRSTDRRRQRARYPRRRHGRCGGQWPRRVRGGPGRPPGQHPRRSGQWVAVPRARDERAHVRRRHRRRRDQHVVLRRPVALQLPEQPGGLTGSASRAAGDHRGHEPGVGLRPLEERDACRLTRQQPRGSRASATRSPPARTIRPASNYTRTIDNATCVDLPVEGPHVLGISALGPSTTKSDYSNYGVEQISLSAPGGWFRDGFGTPTFRTNGNQILSTYPLHILQGGRARRCKR